MALQESDATNPRSDIIQQLLIEAQHRWLRPAEICEILCNYQKFHIASEPPRRPPSGSLFLFDRKVLRYFRKDGHNWRKKKDGKTVKEAHEKLKVGSVDVLHCYYAHGEENEYFQRRSYWMLEQDLMHIVFVHYLEVKGNKTNIGGVTETDEGISDIQKGRSLSFSFPKTCNTEHSGITDSTSPTSTLTSLCEEVDSEDSHQASSQFRSFLESTQMENGPVMEKMDACVLSSLPHPCSDNHGGRSSIPGVDYISHVHMDRPRDCDNGTCVVDSQKMLGLASWEEVFQQCMMGVQTVPSYASISSTELANTGTVLEQDELFLGELQACKSPLKQECGSPLPIQSNWQIPLLEHKRRGPIDGTLNSAFACDVSTGFSEQNASEPIFTQFNHPNEQLVQNNLQCLIESNSENDVPIKGNINYAFSVKRSLLDGEESLKKVDSFSRWITKELGEVDDLHVQSTSGISWSSVDCGNVVDESMLSPSLSQDQLFSIINFWPKWAYTDSETEVLVTGTFLKSQQEVAKCDWSCMFGEVEVPAEVVSGGVLSCYAPPHIVGQVPFYVTCSNRLACSEVREFEYRIGCTKDVDVSDIYNGATSLMLLHVRLESLLSVRSVTPPNQLSEGVREKQKIICQIISLKEEEEYYQPADPTSNKDFSKHEVKEQIVQKLMKERLYSWLLHKLTEDGKGPSVLDDEGQGVLHLAAALGYDWAIKPTVAAGVSINFRDINGWTALHWAAFYGREETVAVLVSMGTATGALSDPSPEFPLGRTPADLASANGNKGISGFLAESSLTSYLSSLTVDDPRKDGTLEVSRLKAVQTVSERTATAINDGDAVDALSLKDSLTAVCNAKQAADRIHQVFRMQSFQRKQLIKYGSDEFGLSDECALSLVAVKTRKPRQNDGLAHAAAIEIQKKFRGWKKRKEFLIIRQRVVKIQAHVRGHQARKQYRAIVWSVGVLKVILRWRRKGTGLRGYRPDAVTKDDPNSQGIFIKEDDYDFLKEGRKQTEERLEKALTRVKSMVQYPEARAQYRRLLNVVEGFRETKVSNMDMNSSEEMVHGEEDLIDIDSLLDDDNFMSIAFE